MENGQQQPGFLHDILEPIVDKVEDVVEEVAEKIAKTVEEVADKVEEVVDSGEIEGFFRKLLQKLGL